MALTGNTNAEKIWYFLKAHGFSDTGAAALMGNLQAESALRPDNLQDTYERKLGMTDAQYVAAVDSGAYGNFESDAAGFGLAQWTWGPRKKTLLAFARSQGKSIGDLEMQLEFTLAELAADYSGLLAKCKSAESIRPISDLVLTQFERPADMSDGVKAYRARLGQQIYDQLAGKQTAEVVIEDPAPVTVTKSSRETFVETAASFIGCMEADGSFRKIIDYYNQHKPSGKYRMSYTDPWCAAFVSAIALMCDLQDIIPIEVSCPQMIVMFQQLGAWIENDAYTPSPGDIIFYDWDDSGAGDNTGTSDHVGIVRSVSGSAFTVIEGNMSDAVGQRRMSVNGRYIRGFGVPKFSSAAPTTTTPVSVPVSTHTTPEEPATPAAVTVKMGDTVRFTGSVHYVDSQAASGPSCKPGIAKVTALAPGAKHPIHLIAVAGGGSTVYGWVNASLVESVATEITVGDIVQFNGGPHYLNANATSDRGHPAAGPARVTAMARNARHPYHIIHTDSQSIVYGWVDADSVTK